MSLANLHSDDEHAKTSVNPAENTKNKNTQLQNPSGNQVSANGNTTDGNHAGHGVDNIRNNPQNNKPMSVDKGKVGKGADTKH